MPIFVNFTKAFPKFQFFLINIGFLWIIPTKAPVFPAKTFVFLFPFSFLFSEKNLPDKLPAGF